MVTTRRQAAFATTSPETPQNDPIADLKMPQNDPNADPKMPQNYPNADPKTPQNDPNADSKTPQNYPTADPNTRKPQTPFSATAIVSASVKSVLLHDWWLVKAKGKGLAVGGFASRESLGARCFSSAEISKRHAATILETADGIMITVSGFLNRSRTHQNGFPSELYNRFLLGFPFDWEEYAAIVMGEDSTDIGASMRNSASKKFNMSFGNNESNHLPVSLDNLPVTRARDLMMLSFGDSDYCSLVKNIFNELLRTSRESAFGHTGSSINLNMENSCTVENVVSGTTETPTEHKIVEAEDDNNSITDENTKSSQKSRRGRCAPTCKGVSTRSMNRKSVYTGSAIRKSVCTGRMTSVSTGNLTRSVSTRNLTRSVSTRSMTTRK